MRLLIAADALAAGRVVVTGDDHHYLFRVRRLTIGDAVTVFDGEGGEADATVERIGADDASLVVGAPRREPPPALHLTVIQALIKGERMDWCVEKLVEVGVDRIIVVATDRAVVKLDADRSVSRQARLAVIAREAAKQARRAVVPPVTVTGFAEALAVQAELRLCCHPVAARPLGALLGTAARSAAILVGPEGGLTPAELDRAGAAGFEAISLGPTVLRTETAGPVAVAALRIAERR